MWRAAGLVILSGCSFLFVHGPPAEVSATEAPDCTQAPFAPIVDGLLTLGGGAMIVSGATANTSDADSQPGNVGPAVFPRMMIGTGIIVGTVALISTIYGATKISRCIQAHRAFNAQFATHN